ncbi:hypothetical protein PRZ48_004247 [Zasmidium cellare]|uniref:Cupin 2 conserved barrel domain-containing protein n=1 Tax=Zasmidium cellare TaxID=395010 RepID=A0ABR0E1G0_ZASCE|nr:hypothetical protein PRZ48_015303 [Zasmidium cellare]KAK4494998.1 hypothetical protein PRZ48_014354 [Zasmidium cellare]KAK4503332.1 hypothetical protein PRZ48_004247 [Zasmidium cellare]
MATTPTATAQSTAGLPPGVRDPKRRIIENPVAGEVGNFVRYSYETQGKYAEVDATCVPGGGPPLHYHRAFAEIFTAVQGDLLLYTGSDANKEPLHLPPGETFTVPIGTLHRFSAGPAGAKFKVRIEPGDEEFEKSLYILFGLARDGQLGKDCLPKNPIYTAVVGSMGGMYFPGAAGALLNGVTSVMAAYARWSGTQDELVKKYWE